MGRDKRRAKKQLASRALADLQADPIPDLERPLGVKAGLEAFWPDALGTNGETSESPALAGTAETLRAFEATLGWLTRQSKLYSRHLLVADLERLPAWNAELLGWQTRPASQASATGGRP